VKARSELIPSTNCGDGGVLDTGRRFQAASAGSVLPARRPTRGSGSGAPAELLLLGDGALERDEEVEAQAARSMASTANDGETVLGSAMGFLFCVAISYWRLTIHN
jgi:hypothetical protein